MRVILFTGKGGVGKTSVAASSALRAAELGRKALMALRSLPDQAIGRLETQTGEAPTKIDVQ